jgi:hypothetical protein
MLPDFECQRILWVTHEVRASFCLIFNASPFRVGGLFAVLAGSFTFGVAIAAVSCWVGLTVARSLTAVPLAARTQSCEAVPDRRAFIERRSYTAGSAATGNS